MFLIFIIYKTSLSLATELWHQNLKLKLKLNIMYALSVLEMCALCYPKSLCDS